MNNNNLINYDSNINMNINSDRYFMKEPGDDQDQIHDDYNQHDEHFQIKSNKYVNKINKKVKVIESEIKKHDSNYSVSTVMPKSTSSILVKFN